MYKKQLLQTALDAIEAYIDSNALTAVWNDKHDEDVITAETVIEDMLKKNVPVDNVERKKQLTLACYYVQLHIYDELVQAARSYEVQHVLKEVNYIEDVQEALDYLRSLS